MLVTGATGFTGQHLVDLLCCHTAGEIIRAGRKSGDGIVSMNLADQHEVRRVIESVRPTEIFHCAGAFTNVWELDFSANVEWTRNLLETVRIINPDCRVLLIGSAAEYGNPPSGAVTETTLLRPVTIYGMTKAIQTVLMEYFCRNSGMDIVMARTFNLFGQGCSPNLFPGRVAEQIERVQQGLQAKIELRSLVSRRDYLDVKDAVCAYARIMNHGKTGEVYNVGSGVPMKMFDLLQRLLLGSGLTMNKVTSHPDDQTESSLPEVYADITKLSALPRFEKI